jgi:hypothetical protein
MNWVTCLTAESKADPSVSVMCVCVWLNNRMNGRIKEKPWDIISFHFISTVNFHTYNKLVSSNAQLNVYFFVSYQNSLISECTSKKNIPGIILNPSGFVCMWRIISLCRESTRLKCVSLCLGVNEYSLLMPRFLLHCTI